MKGTRIKILTSLILFFAILIPIGCSRRAPDQPVADAGVINLAKWDFESLGPVELNGIWSSIFLGTERRVILRKYF